MQPAQMCPLRRLTAESMTALTWLICSPHTQARMRGRGVQAQPEQPEHAVIKDETALQHAFQAQYCIIAHCCRCRVCQCLKPFITPAPLLRDVQASAHARRNEASPAPRSRAWHRRPQRVLKRAARRQTWSGDELVDASGGVHCTNSSVAALFDSVCDKPARTKAAGGTGRHKVAAGQSDGRSGGEATPAALCNALQSSSNRAGAGRHWFGLRLDGQRSSLRVVCKRPTRFALSNSCGSSPLCANSTRVLRVLKRREIVDSARGSCLSLLPP